MWKSHQQSLEFLEKNILLDRNMKEARMKFIDLKIRRNVLIIENKHREILILKCMHRLNVLYSRLRIRGELRRYNIYAGVI